MTTIYLVQGEHWMVPGCPTSIHATEDEANAKARELVNIMLKDCDLQPTLRWQDDLDSIREKIDSDDGDDIDVWITPLQLDMMPLPERVTTALQLAREFMAGFEEEQGYGDNEGVPEICEEIEAILAGKPSSESYVRWRAGAPTEEEVRS